MPPDWLSEPVLKSIYDQELHDPTSFSDQLPWRWLETAQAVLDIAKDDLPSPPHLIRNLLRDIREIRQAKARAGIKEINESHLRMDNLGVMEINELRPFVGSVMDQLRQLAQTRHGATGPDDVEDIPEDDDDDDGAY